MSETIGAMADQIELSNYVLEHVDEAIAEGWIRPYYQAIVRSATGYLCGEEAFARWVDPVHGMLMPEQFMPALEKARQMHKVDLYMVERVLADLKTKRNKGVVVVPVTMNFSIAGLEQVDLAAELSKRVDAAGESHDILRAEFASSALTYDSDLFFRQANALHDAGFKVCLEGFGTGYASIDTLQKFDFDLLELDMCALGDVHSSRTRDILAGIVHIAKMLGVATLAVGIDSLEKALFLENIGCDMLQGYYFATPRSVDAVSRRVLSGGGLVRESVEEFSYWNDIGAVDLADPVSNVDGRSVDGTPLRELPASIMELRDGAWWLVRANTPYREFLDRYGSLPLSRSPLKAHVIEARVDDEFIEAAKRSRVSNTWERIAGPKEYGTGLQFYTRPAASSPNADAYVIATVPNMLGTALGSYGDVPVAYAVLRVEVDAAAGCATDAEYVFANSMYCSLCNYSHNDITGRSFCALSADGGEMWLPYFYRAAVLKEEVRDVVFSQMLGHWLSFNMAPSPIEGCLVFGFTIADAEHREREEFIVGRDTSNLIIEIAKAFNEADTYDEGMNEVLSMMSRTVHPERLYIFERDAWSTTATFEWCAEGVDPRLDMLRDMDNSGFATWESMSEGGAIVVMSDIEKLKTVDPELYERFSRVGISRILAAPLFNDQKLIGFLVADNYVLEEGYDTQRLLETVATFISARIVNQRLVEELERAGTHDALTGLLNRRGFDKAIGSLMGSAPDERYALALIDIDDFKTVNDLHGHDVGDSALRALARSVKRALPQTAVVGRNGGDEFVALLFGTDTLLAEDSFAKLEQMDLGCTHDEKWYPLSISIGYVEYPDQAKDLNAAYAKADAALYAVKLAGKGNYRRYSPELKIQYRSQLGFTPRDIAENAPGAILVHRAGENAEILFANDELIEMFECDDLSDFMEYTGGTFANIVHPDDRVRVYDELKSQVALDEVGSKNFADYRILTKRGNVRHVADNGRLVDVGEVGKVFYVIIIDNDERVGRQSGDAAGA